MRRTGCRSRRPAPGSTNWRRRSRRCVPCGSRAPSPTGASGSACRKRPVIRALYRPCRSSWAAAASGVPCGSPPGWVTPAIFRPTWRPWTTSWPCCESTAAPPAATPPRCGSPCSMSRSSATTGRTPPRSWKSSGAGLRPLPSPGAITAAPPRIILAATGYSPSAACPRCSSPCPIWPPPPTSSAWPRSPPRSADSPFTTVIIATTITKKCRGGAAARRSAGLTAEPDRLVAGPQAGQAAEVGDEALVFVLGVRGLDRVDDQLVELGPAGPVKDPPVEVRQLRGTEIAVLIDREVGVRELPVAVQLLPVVQVWPVTDVEEGPGVGVQARLPARRQAEHGPLEEGLHGPRE